MAARIRRMAMMNTQVRLDSFGSGGIFDNDGIFMTSPLYYMEVFLDLGQGNLSVIPGYAAPCRVKIGLDQWMGVYTVSLCTPPE
jgi:hypothetical protein